MDLIPAVWVIKYSWRRFPAPSFVRWEWGLLRGAQRGRRPRPCWPAGDLYEIRESGTREIRERKKGPRGACRPQPPRAGAIFHGQRPFLVEGSGNKGKRSQDKSEKPSTVKAKRSNASHGSHTFRKSTCTYCFSTLHVVYPSFCGNPRDLKERNYSHMRHSQHSLKSFTKYDAIFVSPIGNVVGERWIIYARPDQALHWIYEQFISGKISGT